MPVVIGLESILLKVPFDHGLNLKVDFFNSSTNRVDVQKSFIANLPSYLPSVPFVLGFSFIATFII